MDKTKDTQMSYLILGSGGLGGALAHELASRGEEWLLAGRQLPKGLDPACYFPLQEVDRSPSTPCSPSMTQPPCRQW